MPLFRRSKTDKRKSGSKTHQRSSSTPIFNFSGFSSTHLSHSAPVHQSSQLILTQTSTWQPPQSLPPKCLGPHANNQMMQLVPYPYASGPAQMSSVPYLPRPAPHTSPFQTQKIDQQVKWSSCQHLPDTLARPCQAVNATVNRTTEYLNRGAALCDQVASKLNDVISMMDEESFVGNEQDLGLLCFLSPPLAIHEGSHSASRGAAPKDSVPGRNSKSSDFPTSQKALTTASVFAKPAAYANSRLPSDLPPFRVYMPTWPLICRAAKFSLNAYHKPRGAEADAYVDADWRTGTKAMVIKSVPIDEMNTIVFAIRGTQTFMDWAVNLNTATASPAGFLDDPGNLCHAGFLDVARKMTKPVALRLREMLTENPSRASCSLVIAGHSAGGAVASLLFCHMLSTTAKSELSILTGCFKRLHCITFGAPPVSLLPLSKPIGQERKLRKHLFLSFINEGDPVSRADKAYVRSLLELYRSVPPKVAGSAKAAVDKLLTSGPNIDSRPGSDNKPSKRPKLPKRHVSAPAAVDKRSPKVVWKVPAATLSNAGRLVILRVPWKGHREDVKACTASDEQLRGVIFGDPLMHQMKLYAQRVDVLATKAATGG